jgi:hypothetical protein
MQTEAPISAADLMEDFAGATGLDPASGTPRRYLWTDAFAVCNYLGLFRESDNALYLELARRLIHQVHHTLGRHRPDDPRRGWISGLDEAEGERRPTAGGLRIGKELPERRPEERQDERLEWEQDGQYYHYLTKWMHALRRMAAVTGEREYLRQALELTKRAHAGFTFRTPAGKTRMHWKMSIDLSRPLVPSMGLHDPLDGLVTFAELAAAAGAEAGTVLPGLEPELAELAELCSGIDLATDDPLGIGGLLFDAGRIVQLTVSGKFGIAGLLEKVTEAALAGVVSCSDQDIFRFPAEYRLPFRDLGLSIGLAGVERMQERVACHRSWFTPELRETLDDLSEFLPLRDGIERFWIDHVEASTWRERRDINTVMLATSLAPDEFLSVG